MNSNVLKAAQLLTEAIAKLFVPEDKNDKPGTSSFASVAVAQNSPNIVIQIPKVSLALKYRLDQRSSTGVSRNPRVSQNMQWDSAMVHHFYKNRLGASEY